MRLLVGANAVMYGAVEPAGEDPRPRGERARPSGEPSPASDGAPLGGDAVTRPVALGSIGQVSLLVRDVSRAERFYRETLGLAHLFTFGDLAFFDCAGVRLFVRAVPDAEWRPSSILYFLVDDIAAQVAALEGAGATVVEQPGVIHRDEAAGVEEWMAFFEDPDRNTLALMSRVPITAG
jgi:catechol 2,3-dioxygenase-like lactoylglutathione lyase family enzyme